MRLSGIIKTRDRDCDTYVGSREALLAAGLVQEWQFPGAPGMRPTSNSFFNGVHAAKHTGATRTWRPDRVTVAIWGNGLRVQVGLSEDEHARRIEEWRSKPPKRRRHSTEPVYDPDAVLMSYAAIIMPGHYGHSDLRFRTFIRRTLEPAVI